MQDFRELLRTLPRLTPKQKCEQRSGFVYKNAQCVEKQCVCGASREKGATGATCPADGSFKCLNEQRAKCNTYVCQFGSAKLLGFESMLCQSDMCSIVDQDTCCVLHDKTSVFRLTIRTLNSPACGTDAQVFAKLDSANSSESTSTASTDWQLLDALNQNDFDQGAVNDYTLRVPNNVTFTPKQVCFRTNGNWCPDTIQSAVTVYNAAMMETAGSQIGHASGYTKFGNTPHEALAQCRPLLPAAG
jgi:hypothetical protein